MFLILSSMRSYFHVLRSNYKHQNKKQNTSSFVFSSPLYVYFTTLLLVSRVKWTYTLCIYHICSAQGHYLFLHTISQRGYLLLVVLLYKYTIYSHFTVLCTCHIHNHICSVQRQSQVKMSRHPEIYSRSLDIRSRSLYIYCRTVEIYCSSV